MTALSKVGERQLAEAEATIEAGLATFIDVGEALTLIREGRLYRAEHETFESYCQARWGFTARRAHQMMTAAEIGTVVPVRNEAQARALASLKDDPDAMQAAYDTAAADGDVTAAGLTRAVEAQNPPPNVDRETGEVTQPSEGVAAPPGPTPSVDPTLGYRARATGERANVRAGLLTLDAHRVAETTDDPDAWFDFIDDARTFLDTLEDDLRGPALRAVK